MNYIYVKPVLAHILGLDKSSKKGTISIELFSERPITAEKVSVTKELR